MDAATLPQFPMRRRCPFSPPPEYDAFRAEQPVAPVRLWNGQKVWLVSRYDDVRQVLAEKRVSNNSTHPNYPITYEARGTVKGMLASDGEPPYFLHYDGDKHFEHRRMVARDFAIRPIKDMEPLVQAHIDELIDSMLDSPEKPVDLVRAFALPLPTRIISGMLGVPYEDMKRLQEATDNSSSFNQDPEEARAAVIELGQLIDDLVTAKEKSPGQDIISRLVVEQVRPGHLTRSQLLRMIRMLLIAGHETTANMISLITLYLLENDDLRARLTEDPSQMTQAVEEMLRYFTIAHLATCRVAIEDFEVAGTTIKAGDGIIALISSADRDGAHFSAPDEVNIDRPGRDHLAFGYGVHQCLGQPLARLELRLAVSTLLRRVPTLRLAASRDSLQFKDYFNGLQSLPVTW
ncbi:cytochrome P450 [Trinickia symbiotica]|nr:cytochrome P450 [Trinickia symbiotica]